MEQLDASSEATPTPLGAYPVDDEEQEGDQSTPVADTISNEHQQQSQSDLAELPGTEVIEEPLPRICPKPEL